MKTLYIDCSMGAAGDMLTAALAEVTGDIKKAEKDLKSLGIPGVEYIIEKTEKMGVTGISVRVMVNGAEEVTEDMHEGHHHEHSHHHSSMSDIEDMINGTAASDKVKKDAINVYKLIAEAESKVHGEPVSEIHFHEVGAMDAVADVTACCYLMDAIGADRIIASPVRTGRGHVHCAHGILPVPAPATANILVGVPNYQGDIDGEMCTPTGAALLKYFADDFGDQPVMKTTSIGYGMGKKDFPQLNAVRTSLGEEEGNTEAAEELPEETVEAVAEALSEEAEKAEETAEEAAEAADRKEVPED